MTWVKTKSSFFKIVLVSGGNIAASGLALTFFIICAKVLPLEDFGRYVLLTTLLFSLSTLMDFGTNSLFVAKSIKNDITATANLTSLFVLSKLLLFGVTSCVSLVVLVYSNLFSAPIFGLFMLGLFGYFIHNLYFSFFQKSELFLYGVLLNVFSGIIKASVAGLVYFQLIEFSYERAFFVFSGSLLSGLLLTPFLPMVLSKKPVVGADLLTFFKQASLAGTSQFIQAGWQGLTNTVVKVFLTFADTAVFSLSNKVAGIFSVLSYSIFTVLLPKNAKLKKQQHAYNLGESVLLAGILLTIGALAYLLIDPGFNLVFGTKYAASKAVLGLLILSASFNAVQMFLENYFYVEETTKFILIVNVTRLTCFVLLSKLLAQMYFLKGIAYAQAGSSFLAVLVLALFLVKTIWVSNRDNTTPIRHL